MSVNREGKTAEIHLAEQVKTDGDKLYIFGEEITKQALKPSTTNYKMRLYAKEDIDILLFVRGKVYGGSTGRTPKIKALKSIMPMELLKMGITKHDLWFTCETNWRY